MRFVAIFGMLMSFSLLASGGGLARGDQREDFFEAKIRPVLLEKCVNCHGETKSSGTLRLDSREALLQGGKTGPAIVPGNSAASPLIKAIQRQQVGVSAMPPAKDKALRPDQVADFSAWIDAGAVWPASSVKLESARHWSFESLLNVAPPKVLDQAWIKTSIDSYIRARQEAAGVRPAPMADKLTLIRRATFDLTGLPPTPEEIEAFIHDDSSNAFKSVVDRLLASPAYGERWGRHWLDVVRYADTAGETADYPVPTAWRYRNYVIDAFNADKPYDQFLREQIAGDIIASQDPGERYAEQVTATGYLAISRRFGFDSENYHHLTIQDTIDTVGQSVLGLSLGCARCHDHKFDAISMQDYYALYGIFESSNYAFPGSEQKQQVRSLAPLLPPNESRAKWLDFQSRLASSSVRLAKQNQMISGALLRSLHDMDGDFELQAAAAGGSNGVLVPPWLYSGKIAVTTAAQSPFKNCYFSGKVGASIAAQAGPYRIAQALYPAQTAKDFSRVYINLDLRLGEISAAAEPQDNAEHRLLLGELGGPAAIEVHFSSGAIHWKVDGVTERLATLEPNQWQNLQLVLDLQSRTFSGRVGKPEAATEFAEKAFSRGSSGRINFLTLESEAGPGATTPTIEYDNLAVRESFIPPVSTDLPDTGVASSGDDLVALHAQLQVLSRLDGDFELQTNDMPPVAPWNPGPNSQVKLSAESQSPFQNYFPRGTLGIHLPNRVEYDGFGWTLAGVKSDARGRLNVNFDFRCTANQTGGDGSWRYYLGHGPGNSAAVELFFNGKEFFRRAPSAIESVGTLVLGEWYQVQLALDLATKTYTGVLVSPTSESKFRGSLAAEWDGIIDYAFIDSHGHIGGVRPAVDADNFVIGDAELRQLDAGPRTGPDESGRVRLEKIAAIRQRIAMLEGEAEKEKQELLEIIAKGPFEMAYGMAEGTPHNARLHVRGEPGQLGEEVPRGLLKVLGGGPLATSAKGSGRFELANWLARSTNPLTARVMANRIWQYHFGQGLVKTPNDFGVRGLPPTHPELLDHLATQFIRNGWSVKALHRLIMFSATYQQASWIDENQPKAMKTGDSSERYEVFRRRRLSAEEIRDAILAVSGELERTPMQEHPFPSPASWGFTQHNPFIAVYDHNHRSVYLMSQRLKRHPFLALFDGADPNATTAQRLGTTVPTQALFFLNDPFVHAKSDRWAAKLVAENLEVEERIKRAWRRAIGRFPTELELEEAMGFLQDYGAELSKANKTSIELTALSAYLRVLFGSNDFLHVD